MTTGMAAQRRYRLYWGDIELPVERVSIADKVVTEVEHRLTGGVYEQRMTVLVKEKDATALLQFLRPIARGASEETLARRVGYGGRKGRRALRRLLAKGFVGTLTVNGAGPVPCPPVRLTMATGRTVELRGRRRR